jgi:hypothetical protein
MSFISDTEECRRLARNVVTADFSDEQIESYQTKEYSYIATMTDKDDWDSDDREFGALQLIETRLVAADIIQHYGDVETISIWQALREAAISELTNPTTGIIDNMDTEVAESADIEIDRTDFKGWGKNSSVAPPNRLGNTFTDTEGF